MASQPPTPSPKLPFEAPFTASPGSESDETCSICRDVPSELDRATVPSCMHNFCAGCIVTAACVRPICALCRAPFSALLVRRELNGDALSAPTSESVALLRRAAWVDARSIAPGPLWAAPPADAALAAAISDERFAGAGRAERSSVPYFVDESIEDAFERMVWEREDKRYEREESRWEDGLRPRGGSSSRAVGNRPFGQNGYLSSGRRMARPTRAARGATHARNGQTECVVAAGGQTEGLQQPARRKKKVKKKSRAGIAAAKAAAEAAAAAASSAGTTDEVVVEGEEVS